MPAHSRIVVAVPTKNMLAFSFPGPVGWSFVSLAGGSESGKLALSRVGGFEMDISITKCFMGEGDDILSLEEHRLS